MTFAKTILFCCLAITIASNTFASRSISQLPVNTCPKPRDNSNKPWQPIFFVENFYSRYNHLAGGLEYCLRCANKSKLFLGAGYGAAFFPNKITGLPKLHLSYNRDGPFYKIEISDRHISASVGLTFLNWVDLSVGYSTPFRHTIYSANGFYIGILIRISNYDRAFYNLATMM